MTPWLLFVLASFQRAAGGSAPLPPALQWRPQQGACFAKFRTPWTEVECSSEVWFDAANRPLCGGIPLQPPDGCAEHSAGVFAPAPSTGAEPLARKLWRMRASVAEEGRGRPCESAAAIVDGQWASLDTDTVTVLRAHGKNPPRVDSPAIWQPGSGCTLLPLDIQTVQRATQHHGTCNGACPGTVLILGDSHMRNMFNGIVGGLRQKLVYAEAPDRDKAPTRVYELRRERDGTYTDSLRGGLPAPGCADPQLVLRVIMLWVPTLNEQITLLKPTAGRTVNLIQSLDPHLVIASPGNSYQLNNNFDAAWFEAWQRFLAQQQCIAAFAVVSWPYGAASKYAHPRMAATEEWMANASQAHDLKHVHMLHLSQATFNAGSLQGPKTFHFACSLDIDLKDENPKTKDEIMRVHAFTNCTDEEDTAMFRAVLTASMMPRRPSVKPNGVDEAATHAAAAAEDFISGIEPSVLKAQRAAGATISADCSARTCGSLGGNCAMALTCPQFEKIGCDCFGCCV